MVENGHMDILNYSTFFFALPLVAVSETSKGKCTAMGTEEAANGSSSTPQFGWYRPRYLQSSDTPLHSFPALSKVVVSTGLDGNISDEEAMRQRATLGYAWERIRPIEEIWHGAPLSDKVPPAKDYERLLLLPDPLP